MIIDFFTFIGPNSEAYAEYLKYTCEIFGMMKATKSLVMAN